MTPCFELFGLPVRFEVDLAALEKAYRAAQKHAHPDRVGPADARTRLLALQQTAAINEAYRILKDPMRRLEELLRRRGIEITEEQKMSAEFLDEILELRESLEEAKDAGDRARVRALAEVVGARRDEALDVLRVALDGGNGKGADLADAYARLKYFARFLGEVSAIEEEDE